MDMQRAASRLVAIAVLVFGAILAYLAWPTESLIFTTMEIMSVVLAAVLVVGAIALAKVLW